MYLRSLSSNLLFPTKQISIAIPPITLNIYCYHGIRSAYSRSEYRQYPKMSRLSTRVADDQEIECDPFHLTETFLKVRCLYGIVENAGNGSFFSEKRFKAFKIASVSSSSLRLTNTDASWRRRTEARLKVSL